MTVYHADDHVTLWYGDCRDVLTDMPDASVHAVVTDPPYELGFMGRAWDASGIAYDAAMWAQVLRVLKPGGHLLAFGGTRTYHRMTAAIEDAGFEIRDCITWIYGSGFPKSLDVSKAIDKAAGATRERVPRVGGALNAGTANGWAGSSPDSPTAPLAGTQQVDIPATPDAARWAGYGTALKPASEPIVVARKPLAGTVAANVLTHGTGALNIDGCRVAVTADDAKAMERANTPGSGRMKAGGSPIGTFVRSSATGAMDTTQGRWPANVVLTHDPDCGEEACAPGCPVAELDRQSGTRPGFSTQQDRGHRTKSDAWGTIGNIDAGTRQGFNDTGGASRFFPVFRYEPKAPTVERPRADGVAHPTVKPLDLMRWLVRLVTPPGGTVLDPFAGSGTTGEACVIEGFTAVLVEADPTHLPLIRARLTKPIQPTLFGEEAG